MADVTVELRQPDEAAAYRMVGSSEDKGVIGAIQASGGSYEPEIMRALRGLIGPTSVVIDVGAHIGAFVLVMSRLAHRGTVVAFEPAPENFDYLARNLEANGATNVVAECSALYDTTGTVPFVFVPQSSSGSFVAQRNEQFAVTPVPSVRLDDYVKGKNLSRIDLLMVDAEGAEIAVLRGAQRTLADCRPALIVEVNPVTLRRFGRVGFRDLVALLRPGRTLFSIMPDGLLARICSDEHIEMLLRREGVVDLLCVPRGHPSRTRSARARGREELRRLQADTAPERVPDYNFVVEPAASLSSRTSQVRGVANDCVPIAVTVRNTSPYWYSSDFREYPVFVCYRWLDGNGAQIEGVPLNRGRIESPLGPNRSTSVQLPVALPPAPGAFTLAVTLLQEHYSWFDDLNPSLRLGIPATVE